MILSATGIIMTGYFDTHVHFDAIDEGKDAEGVVTRAFAAGVERMLAVGGNPVGNEQATALADRYTHAIRAAVGFDRSCADTDVDLDGLRRLLSGTPGIVAVGEIGLDYHYQPHNSRAQCQLMESQLAIAREAGLPAIIHSREADADTLSLLRSHVDRSGDKIPGLLHCFTGTKKFAEQLLAMGYYISFSGIVTFRNAAALREVASHVPVDRLLIETDSPFLAPEPCRGRRNEPALIPHVCTAIAECRDCNPESLAATTRENANRIFGWGQATGGVSRA